MSQTTNAPGMGAPIKPALAYALTLACLGVQASAAELEMIEKAMRRLAPEPCASFAIPPDSLACRNDVPACVKEMREIRQ